MGVLPYFSVKVTENTHAGIPLENYRSPRLKLKENLGGFRVSFGHGFHFVHGYLVLGELAGNHKPPHVHIHSRSQRQPDWGIHE